MYVQGKNRITKKKDYQLRKITGSSIHIDPVEKKDD
jgi:hypothetical protein